jgi:OmpA-OmpF porin, OOP family
MSLPGRPENPLKADSGTLTELARELRRMREQAGLTYRELSAKTGRSPSTLTAAAVGNQLPSWQVTRSWIQACGGDAEAVLRLYERACAEAGRPAPDPDLSSEDPPVPGVEGTAAEFLDQMTWLRIWAGNPSLRTLNKRSGGRLPPSTISEALRRDTLPRRELVLDYVRACSAPDSTVQTWERAWNGIKLREKQTAHAERRDRRRMVHRAARAALSMAVIVALSVGVAFARVLKPTVPVPATDLQPASMPQVCTKNGPVVFVVSGRQNSPAPLLTGGMLSAAITAIREGSAIGLVDLDGRPSLIRAGAFNDPGADPAALQAAQQQYLNSIANAVEDTRAADPHAEVLDALNVAGQAIRAACPHGGTIYLEDSGLQDTGAVNFTQPGMLAALPTDVVAFLADAGDLPSLDGITVVLTGIGDTAAPQQPLNLSQQANVIAIWKAIADAGGATSVRVDPTPLTGPAPEHVPAVALVTVPPATMWSPSDNSYVFADSGAVGFEPNTVVFRDPDAADAALRQLAQYLVASPSTRIELSGTTARWGTLSDARTLSLQRAEAVKAVLVQMGVSPSQIVTRGLAWDFPGYINDQGPGGSLLPGPAEHNRSVIITKI